MKLMAKQSRLSPMMQTDVMRILRKLFLKFKTDDFYTKNLLFVVISPKANFTILKQSYPLIKKAKRKIEKQRMPTNSSQQKMAMQKVSSFGQMYSCSWLYVQQPPSQHPQRRLALLWLYLSRKVQRTLTEKEISIQSQYTIEKIAQRKVSKLSILASSSWFLSTLCLFNFCLSLITSTSFSCIKLLDYQCLQSLSDYDHKPHLYFYYIMSKSYLGSHPQLSRKVNATQQSFQKTLEVVDVQAITQQFILEEKVRIQDLQLLIKAYEVKIHEQQSNNTDHSESIAHLDSEVKMSRAEEQQILEQIQNCRKVENQVTPMQYYLWKKKQRINTYDASIAELCRQVQQNREYLQRSIEEHRHLNEDLLAEIEDLQDKIANFNISILQSGSPVSLEEEDLQELIAQNNKLREDEETLHNDITFLEENRAILEMQVIDNIDSLVSSVKNYYEQEKTSIVRDFKQIQADVRQVEVAALTREELAYNIDPLLNDYSYKMSEMLSAAPESVRKHVHSVLQPLPWKSFNWSEFLGISPNTNNVYDQYTRLQRQFMVQTKQVQIMQQQLSKVKTQLASQQQRSNEIAMNIYKVKQKLK